MTLILPPSPSLGPSCRTGACPHKSLTVSTLLFLLIPNKTQNKSIPQDVFVSIALLGNLALKKNATAYIVFWINSLEFYLKCWFLWAPLPPRTLWNCFRCDVFYYYTLGSCWIERMLRSHLIWRHDQAKGFSRPHVLNESVFSWVLGEFRPHGLCVECI